MYGHSFGPFWLIGAIIVVIPFWRICERLGYSPWLSLLWVVPLLGIIYTYFLAFSAWRSPTDTVVPRGT